MCTHFLSLPLKVEGEVSGARASRLAKKRKEEQEEFEAKKSKIESDLRRSGISIGDKFGGTATDKYEGMYYNVLIRSVGMIFGVNTDFFLPSCGYDYLGMYVEDSYVQGTDGGTRFRCGLQTGKRKSRIGFCG